LKEKAQEKIQDVKEKAQDLKEQVKEKIPGGKTSESKAPESEWKEGITSLPESAKSHVQEKESELKSEGQSLKEQVKEKLGVGESGSQEKERVPLIDKISQKVEGVKNVFRSSEGEDKSSSKEMKEERKPIEEKFSQGVKDFTSSTSETTEPSHGEKLKEKIHLLSDKFRYGIGEAQLGYENLSQKLPGKTHEGDEHLKFEEVAPTRKVNPAEFREFHEVKTGFSETVKEYHLEKRLEELGTNELGSDNPFDILTYKQADIVQPLDPKDVVGGNVIEATKGTFKNIEGEQFNYEEDLEKKSLGQKISGGFGAAKDKISSSLSFGKEKAEDKENVSSNQ